MAPHASFPRGYTPISQIADTLHTWLVEGAAFSAFPDGTASTFHPRLEQAFAWGELSAVGVCVRSGDFVPIPAEAWRMVIPWRENPMPPMQRALHGFPVSLDRVFGPEVYAAVVTTDLARWLGAIGTPEPPSVFPASEKAPPQDVAQTAKLLVPPRKSGPPPQYDWEKFAAEIVRLAHHPDGIPEESALRKHMLAWCVSNFGKEPSMSLFRQKLGNYTALVRGSMT